MKKIWILLLLVVAAIPVNAQEKSDNSVESEKQPALEAGGSDMGDSASMNEESDAVLADNEDSYVDENADDMEGMEGLNEEETMNAEIPDEYFNEDPALNQNAEVSPTATPTDSETGAGNAETAQ